MTDNIRLQEVRLSLRSLFAGCSQALDEDFLELDPADVGLDGRVVIRRINSESNTIRSHEFSLRDVFALARYASLPLDTTAQPGAQVVPRQPHQLARRTDRETSKQAARVISGHLSKIHEQVLRHFSEAGANGLTDYELERRCGSHSATYRSRRAELVEAGRIIDTGRTRPREGSNRQYIVWALKPGQS